VLDDRTVRNAKDGGCLDCSSHGGAGSIVEETELAEEVTNFHERENALAGIEWLVVDCDCNATTEHDEQSIGRITFAEENVSALQLLRCCTRCDGREGSRRCLGEKGGLSKDFFVFHAGLTVLPLSVVATAANEIVWTVVVAAGTGTRFGGQKQYALIGDQRVLDWSIETARSVSDGVVVVVPSEDVVREGGVAGGKTRSESVRNGLGAVPAEATIICVHDAARPFASEHLYREVIAQVVGGADGAVPGLPVTDTIKQVSSANVVVATPDRSSLVAVQTPQAFRATTLREAHRLGADGTDDAALVERAGGRVVVVVGEEMNRKLTTPQDLEWARSNARSEV